MLKLLPYIYVKFTIPKFMLGVLKDPVHFYFYELYTAFMQCHPFFKLSYNGICLNKKSL